MGEVTVDVDVQTIADKHPSYELVHFRTHGPRLPILISVHNKGPIH